MNQSSYMSPKEVFLRNEIYRSNAALSRKGVELARVKRALDSAIEEARKWKRLGAETADRLRQNLARRG